MTSEQTAEERKKQMKRLAPEGMSPLYFTALTEVAGKTEIERRECVLILPFDSELTRRDLTGCFKSLCSCSGRESA